MPFKNKEDQKESSRNHYLRNKEDYKRRASLYKEKSISRNREFVFNYLSEHSCLDCGEKDPIVLEFDHITNDKIDNISDGIFSPWGLDKLIKEISKCEVRCANCHRRMTHKRRNNKPDKTD